MVLNNAMFKILLSLCQIKNFFIIQYDANNFLHVFELCIHFFYFLIKILFRVFNYFLIIVMLNQFYYQQNFILSLNQFSRIFNIYFFLKCRFYLKSVHCFALTLIFVSDLSSFTFISIVFVFQSISILKKQKKQKMKNLRG